jgi:lipopolysaccharide assembly protein A
MLLLIILLFLLAILLLVFELQNPTGITFRLLFWQITDTPLVLVVLVCLVAGFLLAEVWFFPKVWKLKKENKRLRKFKTETEKLTGKTQPESNQPQESKTGKNNPEGIELDNTGKKSFFDE